MMGIFYFSGTGNTEIVANLYKTEFEQKNVKVDIIPIEKVLYDLQDINFEKYQMLGFGYPVHAFSAPSIFFKFIEKLPKFLHIDAFLFKSMGDPLFYGGSTHHIRNMLKKKGINVFHEDFLVMPSNVIIDYDKRLKKQLYLTAKRKIKLYTHEIVNRSKKYQPNPGYLRLISRFFSWMESFGAKYFGKYLLASRECIMCAKCVQNCPTKNIHIINDKLEFGDNCAFCLRCLYLCPQNALRNQFFNFFILKNGYEIKKIIKDDSLTSEFLTIKTRGYFKHFYTYLTHELYK